LQYSDGEDTVPPDEVAALVADADTTLTPPSEYVAIWVKVASAEERIARAKEQQAAGVSVGDQDETSGKDTDSNDKKPDANGPAERKNAVGRSCSEGDGEEPKPRREGTTGQGTRERKKSGGMKKMDEVEEAAEVKEPEVVEAAGDTNLGPLITGQV
jgi:hypothetical protein